jgi:hypothetical protein
MLYIPVGDIFVMPHLTVSCSQSAVATKTEEFCISAVLAGYAVGRHSADVSSVIVSKGIIFPL